MTTFDRKINQIAVRHGWSIEKQPRAAVECYIIDAATYEDAGKIAAALNRCKGLHLETLSPLHYESWAVKICDAGQLDAWRRVVRRSSRPFLLLLSPRCRAVFAVCRRGQILHLTAYRCSGKG